MEYSHRFVLIMENKEITKEMIETVYGDLFFAKPDNERRVTMHVLFQSEEAAEKWMKEFNELVKQEVLKEYGK